MIKAKNPIKFRELIIATAVACAIFIAGAILDFKISQKVFDPVNTNLFGIIMAGIVELPVCIGASIGGMGLIINHPKGKKSSVWFIILGVLAVAISSYFVFSTCAEISDFNRAKDYKVLIYVFAILLTVLVEGGIIWFAIKKFKTYDPHTLFVLSFVFIFMAIFAIAAVEGTKFLWSRPRPYYVYSFGEVAETEFHPFWQLDPFACITRKEGAFKGDAFKSFISGHTTHATLGMFILPLLTLLSPKYKDDRKLQIILFYVGLLWAVVAAISRVLAGMHFTSDVGAGMIVAIIIGWVALFVIFREKKQAKDVNEQA